MLLAIDTATRMMSLALHDGRQIQFERTWHTPNHHTIELTPAIREALHTNMLTPADLAAVAVSQGPGSFTGLRIGMGVAKGLVAAQNLALIAVPTLSIVAAAIPPFEGKLITVLQAGRTRVCAQPFAWQASAWVPSGEAVITTWRDLIAGVEQPTLFAGEIDDNGCRQLADTTRPVHNAAGAHMLRRAGFLAELAWRRLRAGQTNNPTTVTPIYLHQPGVPHP